jgi:hypothetical protein
VQWRCAGRGRRGEEEGGGAVAMREILVIYEVCVATEHSSLANWHSLLSRSYRNLQLLTAFTYEIHVLEESNKT